MKFLQVGVHFPGVLITEFSIFAKRLEDDFFEPRRDICVDTTWRGRLPIKDRVENHRRSGAGECLLPGCHFVQHGAKGKQVCACISLKSSRLFRRKIRDRTDEHSRAREILPDGSNPFVSCFQTLRDVFRKAEIENLGVSTFGDENVCRLDVAMDDAFRVRSVKAVGNLDGELEQLIDRQQMRPNQLTERPAFDELHRDERVALVLSYFINCADVRVVEARCRARLPAESLERLRRSRHFTVEKLQCDKPAKPYVFSLVHDSHAAGSKRVQDSIV